MSPAVEVSPPSRADASRLRAIDAAVRAATGHEAFPEGLWVALEDPARDAVAAFASDAGAVAYRSDSFAPANEQLAVGAAPGTSAAAITEAVDAIVRTRGGDRRLVAWIPGSDPNVVEALTTSGGFHVDRRQFQLRVSLPIPHAAHWPDDVPDDVQVRAFVPGHDEHAWLHVNNRAFANHPDQGGWIAEVLERRMAEPWFDPAGFLMAWRSESLIGFCWTKLHAAPEPIGEIFVIGVDPDAQGIGLGRALVLGGLEHLNRQRGAKVGMLYVAADNAPAVALYRSLGFTTARTDTALSRPPGSSR